MSDPTTTNPAATQANAIIKELENILVPIAQAAIEKALPALGFPIIKQITEAIEQAIADKITKLAETGVTFVIVDLQVGREKGNISDDIRAILRDEKLGDENAIAKDIEKYQEDASRLANDDGSATPE